jgi:hypothetical protein
MVTLFLLCVILHIELLNKICSGACSVMAWVLGLVSLLKLIIMVFQSSELCEYPTYGLLIQVSVIKFSHTMFVSVASVHTLFRPCGF